MSITLDPTKMPKHVTITMDGNRRWAKKRGLSAIAGHEFTTKKQIESLIEHTARRGIPFLTLWVWNADNWNRPQAEVDAILNLFRWSLKHQAPKFIKKGARLNAIGDLSQFPQDIQEGFFQMMEQSQQNDAITVTFALNYGGRDEIVRAINKVLSDRRSTVNEEEFSAYLDTASIPDPDLIIRPGGRQRLSGFLPWQGAYAELYFTDILTPDFDPDELDKALLDYQSRIRTFGGGDFQKISSA